VPAVTVPVKITRAVAWALTAVDALDHEIAQDVLADVELALAVRHRLEAVPPMMHQRIRLKATAGPAAPGAGPASAGIPDRHVPVGRPLPFHTDMASGELSPPIIPPCVYDQGRKS
jgi:hypothetical protein